MAGLVSSAVKMVHIALGVQVKPQLVATGEILDRPF